MWAVTGSVALALHGFELACDDLDVVTDARGAKTVEDTFPRAVVQHVQWTVEDRVRGYPGRMVLQGVPVHVLGDVQNHAPGSGGWWPPLNLREAIVVVDAWGSQCPILDTDALRTVYERMCDHEKVRIITDRSQRIGR